VRKTHLSAKVARDNVLFHLQAADYEINGDYEVTVLT